MITIPKNVMHRTRSDLRTIILCFESESNEIRGDVCTGQISAAPNTAPRLVLQDIAPVCHNVVYAGNVKKKKKNMQEYIYTSTAI